MDTTKDTTMQHVTDVTIVPEATAEFIAGLLARIEQLESDLATAEQDSRQKQARIERLEKESKQAALLDCLNEWKELAKSAEKKCDALNAEIEARAQQEPVAWIYEDMLGRKCVGFNKPLHRLNTHEPLYTLPRAKGE